MRNTSLFCSDALPMLNLKFEKITKCTNVRDEWSQKAMVKANGLHFAAMSSPLLILISCDEYVFQNDPLFE